MLNKLVAFALLGATSAVAIPTTQFYDGMPPERFSSPPSRPVRVIFGHIDKCGDPRVPSHPDAYFESCIRGGITYLPDPCAYGNQETFARLTCHEIGHFNGWPADHGA